MTRGILVILLFAACQQNTIRTPIRSFDRPSDVALGCAQFDPVAQVYDARPLEDCGPNRVYPLVRGPDADGNLYYPLMRALVANSARGELAMVNIAAGAIVDVFRQNPGFGFLPVGSLPEHVRVSPDGCAAVTANVDSCDLALVDTATFYNLPFLPFRDAGTVDGGLGGEDYGSGVLRRVKPAVKLADGSFRVLGARPSWVEFSTAPSGALHGYEPGGVPGTCTRGNYRAWVALPSCQLVVEVEMGALGGENGVAEVKRAVRVTRNGAVVMSEQSELATLSCAAECGGLPSAPFAADGGVTGSTGLPMTQAEPSTVALDDEDGVGRLIIGDRLSERITIIPFEIGADAIGKPISVLGAPRAVTLEAGALGVQVVRVSPRSEAGKFLYAVARDSTVRVIDLDREAECETNPDPRALQEEPPPDPQPDARRLGCFPLGDPSTPRRSALATSPGIALPGSAIPKDVAFVHVDAPIPPAANVEPPAAGPATLVGDFAFIIGSDGRATVVGIFDACPAPNRPIALSTGGYTPSCDPGNVAQSRADALSFPGSPVSMELERVSHRLRGGTARFTRPASSAENTGQPRFLNEEVPFAVAVNGVPRPVDDAENPLPTLIEAVVPSPSPAPPNAGISRSINIIDPDRVRQETWSLTWEGVIPGTARVLGNLGTAPSRTNAAVTEGQLIDTGGAFCSRGALAGDKLVLTGCNDDSECNFLQSCVRDPGAPAEVTTGMCLRASQAKELANVCGELLRAVRRYRVVSARQTLNVPGAVPGDELRFVEIYEPEHPLETHECVTNDDCADVTIANTDPMGAPLTTSCAQDWDAKLRCLRRCDAQAMAMDGGVSGTQACGAGFQCRETRFVDAMTGKREMRCLRAPVDTGLFAACLNELQSYEVRAGEAFLVTGTLTGMFFDLQANPATGECEVPPASSEWVRLHQARIPIDPARALCPPALRNGDPLGILDPTTIDPVTGRATNVCRLTEVPASRLPTTEQRIHFENPMFAIAIALPATQLVPPTGFSLSFALLGGGFPLFAPLSIDVTAQQPRYAAVAPDRQTVFVVDEGKQNTGVGLRGQLFRLSAQSVAVDRRFIVR